MTPTVRNPAGRRRLAASALLLATAASGAGGAGAADLRLAPGQPLDRGVLEQLLARRLAGAAADDAVTVRIDRPDLPLVNRASQPIDLNLTSVQHDDASGRYTVRLAASLPDGTSSTIFVSGVVEELVDVPVLGRAVEAGETITAADIAWKRLARPQRSLETLLDVEAIVGLEARRPLAADRALRARDLRAPLLVQRGEPVSVVYRAGGLDIAVAGTALDVGRLGEVVQVRNPSSGEVRRGVVEARRRVRVDGLAAHP